MTTLPLRLKVEPFAKTQVKSCHILPSKDEDKVCLVVADAGWIATVVSDLTLWNKMNISNITGLPVASVPAFAIVQLGDDFRWYREAVACADPPSKRELLRAVIPTVPIVAEAIIGSISRYYGRQVLEPSIRGFLAILEKQFPRNDLYLFELLQNAVDDGANRVSLKQVSQDGKAGIHFCHNGRGFTPLDVLGLSSVGLSTKGDEEKRKIGFMGIGFKAVYKRFAKVTVFDNVWRFQFEQPATTPAMEPSFSWVLKPAWVRDIKKYRGTLSHQLVSHEKSAEGKSEVATDAWCNFMLERSRGGDRDIRDDLSRLPAVVPVLLGRQAIDPDCSPEEEGGKWILEWGEKLYSICPIKTSCGATSAGASQLRRSRDREVSGKLIGTYLDSHRSTISRTLGGTNSRSTTSATQATDSEEQVWQFLTVCFDPSTAAKAAFEGHTKRPWQGRKYHTSSFFTSVENTPTVSGEEISLFFQVNENSEPIFSQRYQNHGFLHAVLPTKLKLPFAMNIQAAWLLSVDRQEVQSLTDNAWNHCLISQLPDLVVLLLRWLASISGSEEPGSEKSRSSRRSLYACYSLLPPVDEPQDTKPGQSGKLFLNVLGQNISFVPICEAIKNFEVVPALDVKEGSGKVVYKLGRDVMWLPPPMTKLIPADVLYKWFGKYPLASNHLEASSWHAFWLYSLDLPTSDYLLTRRRQFDFIAGRRNYSKDDIVILSFKIMSAFAECVGLKRPALNNSKQTSSASKDVCESDDNSQVDVMCEGMIPPLLFWPIFPTDGNTTAPLTDLALPDTCDFNSVPPDIATILRDGVKLAVLRKQDGRTGSTSSKPSNSRDRLSQSKSLRVSLLHSAVEEAISLGDKWVSCQAESAATDNRKLLQGAKNCLDILELIVPDQVIDVSTAALALFREYATIGQSNGISPSVLANIVTLTVWAYKSDRPTAVSHYLVENLTQKGNAPSSKYLLLPVGQCYVPSIFSGETAGGDAENKKALASMVPFVSVGAYFKDTGDDIKTGDAFEKFLIRCGVQDSVSLIGQCRSITEAEKSSFLPDKKTLPQLRHTNPSTDLNLPFGFGVINRKKHVVIDVDLSPEWTRVLANAGKGDMDSAHVISSFFATLLESTDTGALATPSSTPYASQLLQPNINSASSSKPSGGGVSDRKRWGNRKSEGGFSGKKGLLNTTDVQHNDTLFPNHRIPQNRDLFPPPLFARLFFLPPGQAGAATMGLGTAAWVSRLANERWVPACPPGATTSEAASIVLRPCEVLLVREASSSEEMPVARLPRNVLKVLSGLKKEISDVLSWGSVKPRPPLERFEEIITSVNQTKGENTGKTLYLSGGMIEISPSSYDEIMKLWSLLCSAQEEGRLTVSDLRRISMLCGIDSGKGARFTQKARRNCCIPAPRVGFLSKKYVIFSRDMCINIRERRSLSDNVELHRITAIALCQVGFMVDFGCREYDEMDSSKTETNGGSSNPEIWALYRHRKSLNTIIPPPTDYVLDISSAEFLKAVSCAGLESMATSSNVYYPDELTKKAFSLATWAVLNKVLRDSGNRLFDINSNMKGKTPFQMSFSADEIKKSRDHLLNTVPDYALFCRKGPSASQSASLKVSKVRSCWVSIGAQSHTDNSSQTRPVLMDDFRLPLTGCGVSVSSLLNGTQGFQPIGILDHVLHTRSDRAASNDPQQMILERIDRVAHRALGVPCTSDAKQFSVEVRTAGTPEQLDDASRRISIIMLVLSILFEESSTGRTGQPTMLHACCMPIIKYETLSVTLKCPSANTSNAGVEKTTTSHFALRGPLVSLSDTIKSIYDVMDSNDYTGGSVTVNRNKVRAVYIAGEAEDYTAEIEEFILAHLFGKHHNIVSSIAARKVLSLLSYIEDGEKFNKLFRRQFVEFLSTDGVDDIPTDDAEFAKVNAFKRTINSIYNSLHAKSRSVEVTGDISADDADTNKKRQREPDSAGLTPGRQSAGRGVVNLPAWMTNQAEMMPSGISRGESEQCSSSVSGAEDSVLSKPGASRGIVNLPAWMTGGDSALVRGNLQSSASASEELTDTNAGNGELFTDSRPPKRGTEKAPVAGTGRGVVNLPAWLTAKDSMISVGIHREQATGSNQNSDESRVEKSMRIQEDVNSFFETLPDVLICGKHEGSGESGPSCPGGDIHIPGWMVSSQSGNQVIHDGSVEVAVSSGSAAPPVIKRERTEGQLGSDGQSDTKRIKPNEVQNNLVISTTLVKNMQCDAQRKLESTCSQITEHIENGQNLLAMDKLAIIKTFLSALDY